MLLHLGQDVSVFAKDLVMIMDALRVNASPKTRGIVDSARKSGNYFNLCEGEPRSYVLIQRGGGAPVLYTSAISAHTLYKRCRKPGRGV
jgi:hypothetical protein